MVPAGGVLEAVPLLYYPPGADAELFARWSNCDRWEGAVWIESRGREAVVFAGRRGRGETCYGTPGDCSDPCGGGKGYHCFPYEPELVFYSVDDLAEVAAGTRKPFEVQPFATRSLLPEFLETCHYSVGGMAVDNTDGRLYLVQSNSEWPVVHVWDIGGGVPPGHVVEVTVDGKSEVFEGGTKASAMAKAAAFLNGELVIETEGEPE